MENIRRATVDDLSRIAEIVVFNYRLNFYGHWKRILVQSLFIRNMVSV